jgi:UDP-glucose 4-epimerase
VKICITGLAGFLGSHLADALIAQGHTVVGVDDMSTGARTNPPASAKLTYCDVAGEGWADIEALRRVVKGCDVVYHCAAAAYEGVSVFSPAFVSRNIYTGSANVFSVCAEAKVKRVVFCSSMARYGIGHVPPFVEDGYCDPVDPYGLAKIGAERLLRQMAKTHGFEYVIAVPHNIYGPRQKYDDPYRNVAAIMCNRMLRDLPPIIYGDGSQVRCFSYIDDVVPGLVKMATSQEACSQIINLGPEKGEISILGLAQLLATNIGYKGAFEHMPARPCEVRHATCSARKAWELLGVADKTPLDQGLIKLIDYVRAAGPREFKYHLEVEIENDKTPKTWTKKLI